MADIGNLVDLTHLDRRLLSEIGEHPGREFVTIAFTDYFHFLLFEGERAEMAMLDVETLDYEPVEGGLIALIGLALKSIKEAA